MKQIITYSCLICSILFFLGGNLMAEDFPGLKGPYLGQKPPEMVPKNFAPGIISISEIYEGRCTFSPDQNEFYFSRGGNDWSVYSKIMVSRLENGIWSKPEPVSFTGKHIDFECSISPDGNTMFFNRWDPKDSTIQDGIWIVKRKNNKWGVPEFLFDGNNASVTNDGTLYFAKWIDRSTNVKKIFKSNLENGKYTEPQLVDSDFNKSFYKVNHPHISPDESYIIFDVHYPWEKKHPGLFISFKRENDKWGKAYHLNLGEGTSMAYVTLDMKYLFYIFNGDIYWVSAKVINAIWRQLRESSASKLESLIAEMGIKKAVKEYQKNIKDDDRYFIDEKEFDRLGKKLTNAGKKIEAVEVFKLNAQTFPESWEAWSSLGRSYWRIQDFESALQCFKKSVALNPDDRRGQWGLKVLPGSIKDKKLETRETSRFSPGENTGLEGKYLGQTTPGLEPKLFAPGIVSINDHLDMACTFSPDGKEFYFTRRKDRDGRNEIMVCRLEEDGWTAPKPAPFNDDYWISMPHITPDGKKMFFNSSRPPGGTWVMGKTGKNWGKPEYHGPGNYVSSTNDGTLYLLVASEKSKDGRGGIARSQYINGHYTDPELLGGGVNSPVIGCHTCISPDESFIIFDSTRPGGQGGEGDFYICFRNKDGSWSEAINLGDEINTEGLNICASLSPDGKYLFFGANRDIYWVDAKISDKLKPKNLSGEKNEQKNN